MEAGKLSASASAVSHLWLKTHHQVTFLDILMSHGLKFLKGLNGRINPDNKEKLFICHCHFALNLKMLIFLVD